MKYGKLQQIFSLLACVLMLLAVAVNRDQRVVGIELAEAEKQVEITDPKRIMDDGTVVVSTGNLAQDIKGYGGPIPLEVSIKEGKVTDVKALKNSETPGFFRKVERTGLFSRWTGLSVDEALQLKVDAVSGATFTSNAVIASVHRGLEYAKNEHLDERSTALPEVFHSFKFWATLAVVLAGSLLPLWLRSRRYRMVQLLLNVVVLGCWSGSFLSYSLMVNYLSNGVQVWTSLIPLLLLVVAFVFPLFGKKSHYCTWLCPMGSLQEVMGKCVRYKWSISPRLQKRLTYFREGLWALLMLCMWSGVFFQWMDYELFTAFLFRSASWGVIGAAVLFVLLSGVVARPYCRFVCPTGTLLRISQNSK